MNKSDYLLETIKHNIVRSQAYNILLIQDSTLSKVFYSKFHGWDPKRLLQPTQSKNIFFNLCNHLYKNFNQKNDPELSVSDIVNSVWDEPTINFRFIQY